jgi:hypothetical protein
MQCRQGIDRLAAWMTGGDLVGVGTMLKQQTDRGGVIEVERMR